ncbi:hypothetical protein [Parerythrobacter lacustris]|uniref:Uncharacterized protein n=1 Tax=Parerythrobacter lacustris TaxID=2969984 RepID=A0ABT1XNM3_9SPHN|nr:hypothetical protein [Parerythrobacter lacustris]MCR2832859.1 hypothetical protein [Parerythrobacter lacustris]
MNGDEESHRMDRWQRFYNASPYFFASTFVVMFLALEFLEPPAATIMFSVAFFSGFVFWAVGFRAKCKYCGGHRLEEGYLRFLALSINQRIRVIWHGDCPFCEGWLEHERADQEPKGTEKP